MVEKMCQSLDLYLHLSHGVFLPKKSGLKTVFEIPAHTFTNTPQQ